MPRYPFSIQRKYMEYLSFGKYCSNLVDATKDCDMNRSVIKPGRDNKYKPKISTVPPQMPSNEDALVSQREQDMKSVTSKMLPPSLRKALKDLPSGPFAGRHPLDRHMC